ncbi:hypothetical protein DL89DRAFT_174350 [Linderina pennispora]|uniref:PX domain-containing protein n=1 Tax=Linderina pennispora TaxID=61395 RepID=A0A1Y1W6Z3_9FUNG|nr:uncharacterized protein DL89DRAFT_174350 [Linderina pennispora]ORX69291.1 hypothetical protein DL89DRAFT_174350 [Linderina pennispora]
MRYRFIVFRAQPTKGTITFSIYLEEVVKPQVHTGPATFSAVTSPTDEYSANELPLSTVPQPNSSGSDSSSSNSNGGTPGVAGARITRTLDRTWDQCEWLQKKLLQSFRLQILPPLSERPSTKKLADSLAIERQRSQIERWLNRLGARESVCENGSFDHFISGRMSHDEVGGADKKSFSSKLFNMFTGIADQGFRMYTPIGDINDYDEDEEEQRREYILRVEEYTKDLADAMSNMHAQEEVLDKGVVKVTMAIENAFRSESMAPYDDGSVTKPEGEDHERLTVSLGLLQNASESNYWSNREVAVWKDFNFADTVMEYRTMLGGIKDVMNNATQTLIMYERAMQRQQGYSAKANSLRVQYPSDTPSVKYANEQEILAERELDLARQEYADSCDMVKHELVRYERERAAGMCKALEHTAMLELESAKARMQELRAACRRIKNLQLVKDPPHARTSIGPMLWHGTAAGQATTPITPNTSLPSSLSTLMTPGSQPSVQRQRYFGRAFKRLQGGQPQFAVGCPTGF